MSELPEIERFRFPWSRSEMQFHPKGDFVRYPDHIARMEDQEARAAELEATLKAAADFQENVLIEPRIRQERRLRASAEDAQERAEARFQALLDAFTGDEALDAAASVHAEAWRETIRSALFYARDAALAATEKEKP